MNESGKAKKRVRERRLWIIPLIVFGICTAFRIAAWIDLSDLDEIFAVVIRDEIAITPLTINRICAYISYAALATIPFMICISTKKERRSGMYYTLTAIATVVLCSILYFFFSVDKLFTMRETHEVWQTSKNPIIYGETYDLLGNETGIHIFYKSDRFTYKNYLLAPTLSSNYSEEYYDFKLKGDGVLVTKKVIIHYDGTETYLADLSDLVGWKSSSVDYGARYVYRNGTYYVEYED